MGLQTKPRPVDEPASIEANETRGMLALFVGVTTIGLAPIFVRFAVPAAPLVVGFYRAIFALPFVVALALADRSRWDARGLRWALLAGACFFGDLSLWHVSIRMTNASIATLFVCLAPVWLAIFASVVGGRRMRALGWIGLATAVIGAAVLALAGPAGARFGIGWGELAGLAASFFYAGYTLSLSRARATLSARKALCTSVVAASLLFAIAGAISGDAFVGFPASAWAAMVALGVVVQTLAWLSITWGLGHVDARIGALSLLVQPVSTVVLGHLLLHETFSPLQLAGALLVLCGIGIVANPTRVFAKDAA